MPLSATFRHRVSREAPAATMKIFNGGERWDQVNDLKTNPSVLAANPATAVFSEQGDVESERRRSSTDPVLVEASPASKALNVDLPAPEAPHDLPMSSPFAH